MYSLPFYQEYGYMAGTCIFVIHLYMNLIGYVNLYKSLILFDKLSSWKGSFSALHANPLCVESTSNHSKHNAPVKQCFVDIFSLASLVQNDGRWNKQP